MQRSSGCSSQNQRSAAKLDYDVIIGVDSNLCCLGPHPAMHHPMVPNNALLCLRSVAQVFFLKQTFLCRKCTAAADNIIIGFPTRRCALRRSLNTVAALFSDCITILNTGTKRFRMLYQQLSYIRPLYAHQILKPLY